MDETRFTRAETRLEMDETRFSLSPRAETHLGRRAWIRMLPP